jgi:hypothetical protein
MSKTTGEGPQVFICYDKTYQERALQLHGLLQKDLRGKFGRDVEVFIDQENLATGDEWDAQIKAALESARVLIVLVSDGIVTRPYCRFEFNTMRSRIASGEPCSILAVKWQRDSEIYRSAPLTETQSEKLDRAYLASLSEDERSVVEALRRQQFLDGAPLREEPAASERFNAAFLALSAEVARLYRELRTVDAAIPLDGAERGATEVGPTSETASTALGIVGPAAAGAGGSKATATTRGPASRRLLLSAAAAVVVLAVVAVVAVPSIRQSIIGPDPVEINPPPTPPQEQPVWQVVDRLVENKSGKDVVAYSAASIHSKPLETLSPGVIRPLVAVNGKVESAEVSGVVWVSYPTQVPEVRGFVRAMDLEPP